MLKNNCTIYFLESIIESNNKAFDFVMGCNSSISAVEDDKYSQVYYRPIPYGITVYTPPPPVLYNIRHQVINCNKCGCYPYSADRYNGLEFICGCGHRRDNHINKYFEKAGAYGSYVAVNCKKCGCKKLNTQNTKLKTDDYCSCGHTYDDHFNLLR
jgi:hypothetical protein